MKRFLIQTLAGSGLLFLTMTAGAQQYPRQDYPSRYQMQDEREAREHDRIFDRLRDDLDRAHASTLPFTADRNRVVMAHERVSECQRTISSGDYDKRTCDETVAAIQRVVDLNRLADRNREYLVNDMTDLRRLQTRLEGY